MEVGNQAIHGPEGVAGVDKDIRPLGTGGKGAVLPRQRFQRSAGGGADADDPSAVLSGLIQNAGGFIVHHAQLRVHMVLQNGIRLHRPEGSKSNMKGDKRGLYALLTDFFQ